MIKKIKINIPDYLPDLIIYSIGLIMILAPILIAVFSYYEENTDNMNIVFEEKVNENFNDVDPIVQIAIYATKHITDCDTCTTENFPFCERANEVVDTMMNFNVFKNKILKND